MRTNDLFVLFEDYADYKTSRWVHYTNHEMLTVNLKQGHLDPSGIYFFPEDHNPKAVMWHDMKYRYVVTLKSEARVLDLPKMNDNELEKLMSLGDVDYQFHDYITRYPPKDQAKKVDMAWEQVTGSFKKSRWNAIFRQMGYDAIFDDAGIIHNAEPIQLLVLNPGVINIVSRDRLKPNVFAKMQIVVSELVTICEQFGKVSVEEPRLRKVSFSYKKELSARVEVKRSEDNFANFNITTRTQPDRLEKYYIDVSLSWSNPRLNMGVGATFEVGANHWQFDGLKSVEKDLKRIFTDYSVSSFQTP